MWIRFFYNPEIKLLLLLFILFIYLWYDGLKKQGHDLIRTLSKNGTVTAQKLDGQDKI